jgi:hypothetical protein
MGSPIQAAADGVLPPVRGGIYANQATTTTKYVDLWARRTDPTTGASEQRWLTSRYLTLQADGGDVYFALVDTNAQTLNPATEDGTLNTAHCIKICDGDRLDVLVPSHDTHWQYLAFRTASGTATLRLWPSSARLA